MCRWRDELSRIKYAVGAALVATALGCGAAQPRGQSFQPALEGPASAAQGAVIRVCGQDFGRESEQSDTLLARAREVVLGNASLVRSAIMASPTARVSVGVVFNVDNAGNVTLLSAIANGQDVTDAIGSKLALAVDSMSLPPVSDTCSVPVTIRLPHQ